MSVTNMFLRKVKSDVDLIKHEAKVVVLIGPENEISVFYNTEAKISVIGIIGPGRAPNGYYFQEALLEEIGISRSHPYCKGKVPEALQENGKPKAITYRYGGFSLTQSQYLAVASTVFGLIQELADKRVAGWRSGTPSDPYLIKGTRQYYSRSEERMVSRFVGKGFVAVESGARFSVELNSPFVSDIFWAGYDPIRKFAWLINTRLGQRAKRKKRSRRKFSSSPRRKQPIILRRKKKDDDELQRFIEVKDLIKKSFLPEWLLPATVLCLPEGKNNRFAAFLEEILPSWEEKAALAWQISSQSLPEKKTRLGDIRLRLKRFETEKKYVVFEAMPSEQWWQHTIDRSVFLDSSIILAEELTPEELASLPF